MPFEFNNVLSTFATAVASEEPDLEKAPHGFVPDDLKGFSVSHSELLPVVWSIGSAKSSLSIAQQEMFARCKARSTSARGLETSVLNIPGFETPETAENSIKIRQCTVSLYPTRVSYSCSRLRYRDQMLAIDVDIVQVRHNQTHLYWRVYLYLDCSTSSHSISRCRNLCHLREDLPSTTEDGY